ncbi:MAG: pentapeptide repeat-containing protein [Desulfurivibrionaceae bacterium]
MTNFRIIGCFLTIAFLSAGCGQRLQIEDSLQSGGQQLSKSEIRETLTGATINLTSWDDLYEAEVKLLANGDLKAENDQGERDKGFWQITGDDRFCFGFRDWVPGEMTCYSLIGQNDYYQLFSSTGGLEFTFEITEKDDPEVLQKTEQPEDSRTGNRGTKKSWYSFLWPFNNTDEVSAVKPKIRRLLEDKECVDCDLSGENLAGADLDDADLEGAILKGADLRRAVLTDSNLTGADLSGTNLREADLRGAVLKNAILSEADLELALLKDADLKNANLSNARLADADLDKSRLVRANLQGADLHWARLRKANLKGADLENAYLVKADFRKADLNGANLSDAVIQRTIFKDCKGYSSADKKEVK